MEAYRWSKECVQTLAQRLSSVVSAVSSGVSAIDSVEAKLLVLTGQATRGLVEGDWLRDL
jgi:hypothetical protein